VPDVPKLKGGRVLESPVTGRTYEIEELLGAGGFGAAYLARDGRRSKRVCLKVTLDQASWHREAYLGELLDGHARVVRIHETFPVQLAGRMAYAVVMELAEHGTLADVLEVGGPFTERRAIRETRGILTAVDLLHRSGALHRDITPVNVFFCDGRFKLGDFGICRHTFGKGTAADAFAPWFVDSKIFLGSKTRWTVGDDLWQVGQLLVGMITGDVWPIHRKEIRKLPCSDLVKSVLYRALGDPVARFADAAAMSNALRPAEKPFGRVRSIEGLGVVFTGPASRPRRELQRLAERAGATVKLGISKNVDVLVVGDDAPAWVAGSVGGAKLLEVAALRERGHHITLIHEAQFLRLVEAR
jgi:serine/threonine protein kinase